MRTGCMKRLILAAALTLGCLGAAPSPPPDATVHIRGLAFVPKRLVIHVGQHVRFINDDSDAHTATAKDKSFDSGGLDTGESWEHAFTTPGTIAYLCALHPFMTGTIVVSKEKK